MSTQQPSSYETSPGEEWRNSPQAEIIENVMLDPHIPLPDRMMFLLEVQLLVEDLYRKVDKRPHVVPVA